MKINGHDVEEASNGAWWVRRPGSRRAWRFATRQDALRFAKQLQTPAPAPPIEPYR